MSSAHTKGRPRRRSGISGSGLQRIRRVMAGLPPTRRKVPLLNYRPGGAM